MYEPTREQNEAAEELAEKHGRCRVSIQENEDVILTGIAGGDVEMECVRVTPDGKVTSAEFTRQRAQVVTQPVGAGPGYLVIRDGKVLPVNTLEEAARWLVQALHADRAVRVRVRISLTRDRALTMAETRALLAHAAGAHRPVSA